MRAVSCHIARAAWDNCETALRPKEPTPSSEPIDVSQPASPQPDSTLVSLGPGPGPPPTHSRDEGSGADVWLPTRDTLLSRLRQWDDQEAWREFFENYWKLIFGAGRRYGLTEDEAREVVQETVLAIAKLMPGFQRDPSQGSFKTWLFTITRNKAIDHLRRRNRRPELVSLDESVGDRTPWAATIPDLKSVRAEAIWDEEWDRRLLEEATRRVKATVSPTQFQIFDLYAVKNWSRAEVCRTLGVSAAQVYLAKHRIARLLRAQVGRLRKEWEGGGEGG